VIVLTMICLRSGLFQMRGIVLNIRDKVNPNEELILKYVNELSLIVENEREEKKDTIMEKTAEIVIDSLL
jgi:hypothetical protein